jgi:hypothetical protein
MSRGISILYGYPNEVHDSSHLTVLCDKHVPFYDIIREWLF